MENKVLQRNELPVIKAGLGKRQIAALAGQTVDGVMEADSALPLAEAIAAMEEFAKQVRKDERFVDRLRDEIIMHNGRMHTASGAKLEVTEAAVQYDYAQDGGWRALTQQIEALMEARRQLEVKLRSIAPGKMWVDHETGEVLEGPQKSSRSTYRITLSK